MTQPSLFDDEPTHQPRWACWLRHGGEGAPYRFILWIHARWAEFDATRPKRHPDDFRTEEDHAAFDAWLSSLPAPYEPNLCSGTMEPETRVHRATDSSGPRCVAESSNEGPTP